MELQGITQEDLRMILGTYVPVVVFIMLVGNVIASFMYSMIKALSVDIGTFIYKHGKKIYFQLKKGRCKNEKET